LLLVHREACCERSRGDLAPAELEHHARAWGVHGERAGRHMVLMVQRGKRKCCG
jgi:hypothetical protein